MVAEEVTEAQLPFGMGSIDFSNPLKAGLAIVGLVLGFAVFSIANGFGDVVASRINQVVGNVTGIQTSTDSSSSSSGPGVV